MQPAAVIFDMDGTLVDNNPFHVKAWQAFYQKRGRELSLDEYKQNINGRVAKDIFPYIFQRQIEPEEIALLSDEKESLYRELYKPHIKPIDGLVPFLEVLKDAGLPMAIATSGLPVNIDFLFEHLVIKKYFQSIIDASQITKGKPNPEIFLKAAQSIHTDPLNCVVFEDSVSGIAAAKAAGMKVVALTTMQERGAIQQADLIIDDYTQINLKMLRELWQQ
jgi:beta-phosphoglucomutase family hydrolase